MCFRRRSATAVTARVVSALHVAYVHCYTVESWVSRVQRNGCNAWASIWASMDDWDVKLWLGDDINATDRYKCLQYNDLASVDKTGTWCKGSSWMATTLYIRFEMEEHGEDRCKRSKTDACLSQGQCTIRLNYTGHGTVGKQWCEGNASKGVSRVEVSWEFSTPPPTASPTWAPSPAPTPLPTTTPTTGHPSTAPTVSPSFSPTGAPTMAPTVAPSSSVPSSAPTATPSSVPSSSPSPLPSSAPTSGYPSVPPTQGPTTAPSEAPTAVPTAPPSPSAPTQAPVAPVPYCAVASEGAACPGDDWEVTLDLCFGGDCRHFVAAAAVVLRLYDSAGTELPLNMSATVDYTPLGITELLAHTSRCDALPGVAAPDAAPPVLQHRFGGPLNLTGYHLSYAQDAVPARFVVGWRLEGRTAAEEWRELVRVLPNETTSFDLLHGESAREGFSTTEVLEVKLYATHVRGDHAYDCRWFTLARVSAAALSLCCCVTLIVVGGVLFTVCGCGALAVRQKAVDPVQDAPWMGTEDHVRAQVLECFEELERRWREKRGSVLDEAAQMLTVPQDKNAVDVLRAHSTAEWREHVSMSSQLRVLPSAAVELLRRYSHEAQDTDYICGLPGAPKPFASYKATDPDHPKAARAAWQDYKAKCRAGFGKPYVNPALYSELNRLARESAEGGSEAIEAWDRLTRIIKQTCLLIAIAVHATDPPLPAATGVAARIPRLVPAKRKQRWLRMLSLPDAVRHRFSALKPGMCIAWSVGVASVTYNRKASADFMSGGPGRCVLVRMTAPQSEARALSLGPASLYGGEGELLVALGTMFRVRRVSWGRMLTRYIQPTAATPVTFKDLLNAVRQPLLIVDVDWFESPKQWCPAAKALCEGALHDAWDTEDVFRQDTQEDVFASASKQSKLSPAPSLAPLSPLLRAAAPRSDARRPDAARLSKGTSLLQPQRPLSGSLGPPLGGPTSATMPPSMQPPLEERRRGPKAPRRRKGQPKRQGPAMQRAASVGRRNSPSPPHRRVASGDASASAYGPLPVGLIPLLPCTPALDPATGPRSWHGSPLAPSKAHTLTAADSRAAGGSPASPLSRRPAAPLGGSDRGPRALADLLPKGPKGPKSSRGSRRLPEL